MSKPTFGPQVQERVEILIGALLAYANDELEDCEHLKLEAHWQVDNSDSLKLVVRTTLRTLQNLTNKYGKKLTKEQVREALKRLADFLHILEDNRTKLRGSENWHFTLKLWHKNKEENLRQLTLEWNRRKLKNYTNEDDNTLNNTQLFSSSYSNSSHLQLNTPVALINTESSGKTKIAAQNALNHLQSRNKSTPSLLYKLGPGDESSRIFRRICNEVLSRHASIHRWQFKAFDNLSGSFEAIDALGKHFCRNGELTAWSYQFCGSPLQQHQKLKIEESLLIIRNELRKYSLNRLILWVAEDLNQRDILWLNSLVNSMNLRIEFILWGSTENDQLFAEFPDIGVRYLPELHSTEPDSQEVLISQINGLVSPSGFNKHLDYTSGLINPNKYLTALRRELAILNDEGFHTKAIDLLKSEIKRFCVSSEIYFTLQASETGDNLNFFYSCSSLIDYGASSYLADDGWLLLLRMMGQAARSSTGKFMRVFFIKPLEIIKLFERDALGKIIKLHLRHQVAIALFSHDDITQDVFQRRNIALMGGKALLCATDQVQWDLRLTSTQEDIDRAQYQHSYFRKNALCIFYPNQEATVDLVLSDLFPIANENEFQQGIRGSPIPNKNTQSN